MTAATEQYPFIVRDPNLGAASLAPFLPITLVAAKSISVSGLLDSGGTVSVLPYGVGEQLGAVWEQQTTAVALSGNLAACEARARGVRQDREVPNGSASIRLGQDGCSAGVAWSGQLLHGIRRLFLSIALGLRSAAKAVTVLDHGDLPGHCLNVPCARRSRRRLGTGKGGHIAYRRLSEGQSNGKGPSWNRLSA